MFLRHSISKTSPVFNEMVTTSPDLGCYRLVQAEDDQFIVFQSRYQLCSGPLWVLLGCYNKYGSYFTIFHDTYLENPMIWSQLARPLVA
jgi:hypothetical protein